MGLADLGMAEASTRLGGESLARGDAAGEVKAVWTAAAITVSVTTCAAVCVALAAPFILSDLLHARGALLGPGATALRVVCVIFVAQAVSGTLDTPQVVRLVPIKRVDRFLRIAAALRHVPGIRFLIVGDGELRDSLQRSPEAHALGDRLVRAGFRHDMPAVYFASGVVVQTSDNEATPVSLIEAQAAGVPVLATRVGGTASAVADPAHGFVAAPDDESKPAAAAQSLLSDTTLATEIGDACRWHALERFSLSKLVERVDQLYRELLA